MIIRTFPCGPFATNTFVVACPVTRRVAIIDAAPDCSEVIPDFIEEISGKVDKILLTHSHWDHIVDTAKLKEMYHAPIYIHSEDKGNLEKPGSDGIQGMIKPRGVNPDHLVKDGDIISVGDLEFEVIHTPGHTPGGVCYYCKKEKILFSGDTLFKGTYGNLSLPTSEPKRMWPSLKALSKLPQDTSVYPGHGLRTTIGAETWLTIPEKL